MSTSAFSSQRRRLGLWLALTLAPVAGGVAQAPAATTPFTIEDALDVVSYNIADISDDGEWIVATSASRRDLLGVDYRRDGDPTYIRPGQYRIWTISAKTGAARELFPEKRNVRNPVWSPDGSRLALLVVQGDAWVPLVWTRATAKLAAVKLPKDRYVAENSELRWSRDGRRLLLALRSLTWKERVARRFAEMTGGPVFVQSGQDPFLAWDDLRRQGSVRAVVAYDLASGAWSELLPETMVTSWSLAEDDSTLTYAEDITPRTDYDVIFGTETRLMARTGGKSRTVLPTTKGATLVWYRDGLRLAYTKDGRLLTASVADTARRLLAGRPEAEKKEPEDTTASAREAREKERFTPLRWSASGTELIASNKDGLWVFDLQSGSREMFLATGDSAKRPPRYAVVGWSGDGRSIYLSHASRTAWERGFLRYDRGGKHMDELVQDARVYSTPRFSRNQATAALSVAAGNRPPDLYLADESLRHLRRVVETNPQLAGKALATTELLSYADMDGKRQFGVVYYPPGYQRGKPYPTVFNVYEEFFEDSFDGTINVLAANGYVVARPSVSFETGFPGEAWLKGVTAAANALVERGVADSARLGVHGTSYGGYATNLLITQTHRFKAAINISGKVDIISFYTDSPRLGVRNVHAAEKSQDRIGATLWQQPQKYAQHSAVLFADRITTPLLLLTGEQDSNVPAGNTREMFYALRRLGKEVVWVNYMNSGHGTPGTTAEDFTDFHRRMVEWYDKHLKAPAAAASTGTGR